jgi:hypothetical protein
MTNNDRPRNTARDNGLNRWDDEGGARARKRSRSKSLPPTQSVRLPPNPADPLLNPATSMRYEAEDAVPAQPNEPPEPDSLSMGTNTDSDHPLGGHERQGSR